MEEKQEAFLKFEEKLRAGITENKFVKLTLGKKANKQQEIKNIYIRKVIIKNDEMLSFTYRYDTKDQVKNYSIEEGIGIIINHLGNEFLSANLFLTDEDIQLEFNKKRKARIITKQASVTNAPSGTHDKVKHRFVNPINSVYLNLLGITNKNGQIRAEMHDKFKQIDKYIEIVDSLIKTAHLPEKIHIVDMGSGKGYLTFALYDYITNVLKKEAEVTGVELREELVNLCNDIAVKSSFDKLKFVSGDIYNYKPEKVDVLIALHACDTATDDAIYKGITQDASLIICAPCCHKQIRKQMKCKSEMAPILKHGIFEERQAEMITDGMRALYMEMSDYKAKAFEFISSEHTGKNVMIVGTKRKDPTDKEEIQAQIDDIKKQYSIKYHYLEKLLKGTADKSEKGSCNC